MSKNSEIERFPTYHSGKQIGAILSFLQTKSTVKVELRKRTRSVLFSYEFTAPDKMPAYCEFLYDVLLDGWRNELQDFLVRSLDGDGTGRRTLHSYIDKRHHKALRIALEKWLENALAQSPKLAEHLEQFAKVSPSRSGPDAKLALEVRRRYDEVFKRVCSVRTSVPKKLLEVDDETELITRIEESGLDVSVVRAALRRLLGEIDSFKIKTFFGDAVTPAKLAQSIVLDELERDGRNPLKIAVPTFVKRAKELRSAVRPESSS